MPSAFDAENPTMPLSPVVRKTRLSRATARRFLHTLVDFGCVAPDGRLFWLPPRPFEIGCARRLTSPHPLAAQIRAASFLISSTQPRRLRQISRTHNDARSGGLRRSPRATKVGFALQDIESRRGSYRRAIR
ncbi:helix-turn-helix domain-containing protein [Microbacterium sp. YMB-B2]|uniref:Helix-turn-helix domain-containing protein n=1 Tax=Microbacterium tenebrionis TaxID=2830665 RepID=A0A9X1LQQ0_9MICO|nr:helix-turn-helix domain-containing protein [Microbacterium tenebrionis]MCC2030047.1 helix-turn-helix domain-containing protein [Microbacterium tenebrionis]